VSYTPAVREQIFDEDLQEWKTADRNLVLPDELPGKVGDKAEKKLDATINMDRKPNNNRDAEAAVSAETSVSTSQFQEVTSYLYKRMISKYNRGDDVDIDKLTSKSQKEIARYYFDQLQVFPSQQKKTG
jgi:hypothetical protein